MKKSVLVSTNLWETRVALLESAGSRRGSRSKRSAEAPGDGFKIAELFIERSDNRSLVSNIYKGVVENVVPGLEAAFIDIGLEKNGFLHVDQLVLPGVEVGERGSGRGRQISDLIKPGQELVVQVIKDPLKTKGARLTMDLTIAGRYLVYMPTGSGFGVSKRLPDGERSRLRKEIRGIEVGSGGAIVRTAARSAKREDFERELIYLKKLYEILMERVDEQPSPSLVFQEADLPVRVMRDILSDEFDGALIDDEQQHHRLRSFLERTAPDLADRVELYTEDEPLCERFGVEEALQATLSRRVDLPSGGYLVIDYAEALTVIDVNSGSFTGKGRGGRLEETITQTNLEAAEEIVRQIRLRDIGGIIIIDFIDMARAQNKDAVLQKVQRALDRDRNKSYVVEISPLGLVEMTRQNITDGVREIMTRPCSTCDGDGVVRSEETVAVKFERRMRQLVNEEPDAKAFLIRMNPRVRSEFTGHDARVLRELEQVTGREFYFEGSEALPIDHFELLGAGETAEISEQARRFTEGDEVYVRIEEPHMYREGAGVARIDGYIVSVDDALGFIGEDKLVKIEKVGRFEADAVLAEDSADSAPSGTGGRATSRSS